MAALYAKYITPDGLMRADVIKMSQKLGSLWELLADATFPLVSYFSGSRFSKNIREIIGADIQIEDLWIKYLCMTTNVSAADIQVHRQGSLWSAVRASMTILDYLPPFAYQNGDQTDLLIDGVRCIPSPSYVPDSTDMCRVAVVWLGLR